MWAPTEAKVVKKSVKTTKARSGKWFHEEEELCNELIIHFNEGLLDIEEGLTLRTFLADRLQVWIDWTLLSPSPTQNPKL